MCLVWPGRLGLESVQDAAGNIVVRKPARPGREAAVPAALQGHLDMVCEKNEGTVHNFDTDPIRLVVDGDWLKADGTTLGADNGVGVAAALAVMESETVAHGPLEFVFTIDEESGLTGASKFPAGLLKARYFLNLDNEEEDTLCIGCAGGVNSVARRKIARRPAHASDGWRIAVAGLAGGHSGVDIHRGRGNALRILGRALQVLGDGLHFAVAEIEGGSKRNAIPREASAVVVIDPADAPRLTSMLAACEAEARADLGCVRSGPAHRRGTRRASRPGYRGCRRGADCGHAGRPASRRSRHEPGRSRPGADVHQPGHCPDRRGRGGDRHQPAQFHRERQAGRRPHGRHGVPAWAVLKWNSPASTPDGNPSPRATLCARRRRRTRRSSGRKPELIAMHAGLECGVIGEKHPGMQMISFGPHIVDVHSPSERLKISSVGPFYNFLTGLLERI